MADHSLPQERAQINDSALESLGPDPLHAEHDPTDAEIVTTAREAVTSATPARLRLGGLVWQRVRRDLRHVRRPEARGRERQRIYQAVATLLEQDGIPRSVRWIEMAIAHHHVGRLLGSEHAQTRTADELTQWARLLDRDDASDDWRLVESVSRLDAIRAFRASTSPEAAAQAVDGLLGTQPAEPVPSDPVATAYKSGLRSVHRFRDDPERSAQFADEWLLDLTSRARLAVLAQIEIHRNAFRPMGNGAGEEGGEA